jgi:hypothetical protein
MKIAFVICTDVFTPRVMDLLRRNNIDYFTRWEQVKGKGHGTEAHLGTRSFPELNSVLMIAFQDIDALETLVVDITALNATIQRVDDRVRLFELPLDRIV